MGSQSCAQFETVLWVVGFILFITLPFIIPAIIRKSKKKKEDELKQFMTLSGQYTATLIKRGPGLSKGLKVKDIYNSKIGYNPEKIHYSSATVGGITTGGFYKTGGNYYEAGKEKTGYYNLCYNNSPIFFIQLSDKDYNAATESQIANYLNNKKQIVLLESNSFEIKLSASTPQEEVQRQLMKQLPSYDRCIKVRDWLCANE